MNIMELKTIKKTKNELEIEVTDENETILNPITHVLTENKEAIEYCHEEAASGGGATTAANIGLAFGCGMYNVYEKAVPSLVFLFLMLPNNPVFFITGAHLVRKYLE